MKPPPYTLTHTHTHTTHAYSHIDVTKAEKKNTLSQAYILGTNLTLTAKSK